MKVVSVALILMLVAALMLPTVPAMAWICPPGVPDTPENQAAGICVEHPQDTPTPTSVPTSTPTATAVHVPATATSESRPVQSPTPLMELFVGPRSRLQEYCHYEPTTGRWEIRLTSNTTLPDERPLLPGVCDQHEATPVPTATAVPTTVPTEMPTATPVPTVEVPVVAPPAVPVPEVPPVPETPVMPPPVEPAPPAEEEVPPPAPVVPVQIPR